MTTPVVLSASSLNTFEKCPQRWYYEYVLLWPTEPSVQQALGIAVHAAIEYAMRHKQDLDELPSVNRVVEVYDREFRAFDLEPTEDVAEAYRDGVRLLALFIDDVGPRITPTLIEQEIQISINGIPYSGVIDLVDDRGRIRDWKTTARRPRPASYTTNMVGYALAYRHLTGETESEVVLDYLVRTKKAQYIPLASGGPITDEAITTFVDKLEYAADLIAEGKYPASGLRTGECRWCPFTAKCEAYQQRMVE